ncbi:hypothetical protein [Aeoliella sp.]|uniref:hypothetical protein n=1 Tax=Aeoliella sp. TaxID=2795800 RepID=UPI003CCC013B
MKKLLSYLALIAGAVGVVACLVALVTTWSMAGRAQRVTQRLYAAMDDSLAGVQDRVEQVEQRVAAMNITAGEITTGLKDRTAEGIRDRLATELQLEQRTAGLAAGVDQADEWAAAIESSVESVRTMAELLAATGLDVDPTGIDGVLEEIVTVRSQLAEAGEQVAALRQRVASDEEDHDGQIAKILARVVATLTSLDERMGDFGDRLSAAQQSIATAEGVSQRWITTLSILATLLLIWVAAGQGALARVGWKNVRSGS